MRSLVPKSVKKIAHLGSKSENFAHLSQDRKNSSHISNQPKSSILHPAGRFQLHFNSVRSNMVQPCTRFAGIPEASSLSAFSLGFSSSPFLQCSTGQQSTSWAGVYATPFLCERRFYFSRTRLMLLWSMGTTYQHSRWSGRSLLISFSNVTGKHFLSGYISL